ncbi:MAG: hypothetical protein L0H53_12120 [Candidatus Nitrosocosmicus sp.]|nr:hypothetical protein [Candidatus Nitrosocosmicus sp.]MDN5868288.1 hypothetical protein [Candidatus Nitrosocosmicus sp.]
MTKMTSNKINSSPDCKGQKCKSKDLEVIPTVITFYCDKRQNIIIRLDSALYQFWDQRHRTQEHNNRDNFA